MGGPGHSAESAAKVAVPSRRSVPEETIQFCRCVSPPTRGQRTPRCDISRPQLHGLPELVQMRNVVRLTSVDNSTEGREKVGEGAG